MLEDLIEDVQVIEKQLTQKGRNFGSTHDLRVKLTEKKLALANYVLAHERELVSAERNAMPVSFLDDLA